MIRATYHRDHLRDEIPFPSCLLLYHAVVHGRSCDGVGREQFLHTGRKQREGRSALHAACTTVQRLDRVGTRRRKIIVCKCEAKAWEFAVEAGTTLRTVDSAGPLLALHSSTDTPQFSMMSRKLPKTHEFVGDSFDMWQWGQECFVSRSPSVSTGYDSLSLLSAS